MSWSETGATQFHAQLGVPDNGRAMNEFVVCYDRDQQHLDLLNGMARYGCYQPFPEV